MSDRVPVEGLWDRTAITKDKLLTCLKVIWGEPEERHEYLIRSLIADHAWVVGSDMMAASNVVLAALCSRAPLDPENPLAGVDQTTKEGQALAYLMNDLAQVKARVGVLEKLAHDYAKLRLEALEQARARADG